MILFQCIYVDRKFLSKIFNSLINQSNIKSRVSKKTFACIYTQSITSCLCPFPVGVYVVRHPLQFLPPSSVLGLLLVDGSK